jgi:hypothetical protein
MFNKVPILTQVFAIAVLTVSVVAQPSGRRGGFSSIMNGGGMTPDYMLRDLQKFNEAFILSEDQLVIVEQILRDYDESFREASDVSQEGIGGAFRSMRGSEDDPSRQRSDELRTRSRDIRDKLDSAKKLGEEADTNDLQTKLNNELESIRDEMRQARVEQWQSPDRQAAFEEAALLMQDQLRLKQQMKNELEGDLVAILTEEQLSLWPPLRRQLLRDRLLPRGRLSGEKVDVLGLVEEQNFEDAALVTLLPVLEEWDVQVSSALTARDNHMIENQGILLTAMRTMDTSSGLNVMKTQGKLAEAVRDVNDQAIETIVLLLPADTSKAFDAEAKRRGYPRIYRGTRAERAYKAAQELEGLEPDILQAIVELEESMLLELAYSNEHLFAETHRWEAQEELDRMNRFAERMTGSNSERPESPIQKAEESKQVIEDNYLEQLKMLLTEEQIEALGGLEKRKPRDERNQGRGGNRGGQDNGRAGFEGGREQFMKQFDKDGNGEISDSEREAIREHFRNGGGRPGGEGRPD